MGILSVLSGVAGEISNGIYDITDQFNPILHTQTALNDSLQERYDRAWKSTLNSARDAMNFEAEEAQKNRDFQKVMSDTAYQRAVSDMTKAGLNPILALGSAASTPSGGQGSGFSSARDLGTYSTSNSTKDVLDVISSVLGSTLSSAKDIGIAVLRL